MLLRPLAYDSPERLVTIWENNVEQGQEGVQTSTTTYVDWRTRSQTLESIAVYQYVEFTLTGDGDPVRVPRVRVSPAVFRILGVRLRHIPDCGGRDHPARRAGRRGPRAPGSPHRSNRGAQGRESIPLA